jgi:hypothetical protein
MAFDLLHWIHKCRIGFITIYYITVDSGRTCMRISTLPIIGITPVLLNCACSVLHNGSVLVWPSVSASYTPVRSSNRYKLVWIDYMISKLLAYLLSFFFLQQHSSPPSLSLSCVLSCGDNPYISILLAICFSYSQHRQLIVSICFVLFCAYTHCMWILLSNKI